MNTPLPLDAAALDRWSALLARIIDHSDGTRPFAEVYDDELEPFIAQSRAALTLAARVAELEAELAGIKRPCVIRRGHEREDLMAHGETVLCSTDLVARLYDDRITAEAHANALRDALVRWADANDAARRANLLLGVKDEAADREYREAGDALMRLARNPAHPAASLAAYRKSVLEKAESSVIQARKAGYSDTFAGGLVAAAKTIRALAAQEVKP